MNEPYIETLRKLYKQVIYVEDKEFEVIRQSRERIENHFSEIGVKLVVVENDMAYPSEKAYALEHYGTDRIKGIPKFVSDKPLNYYQSILCVVLLEFLRSSRRRNPSATQHFVSAKEIKDELVKLLKEKANAETRDNNYNSWLSNVEDLGYIKYTSTEKLPDERKMYELKRILMQRFDSETLEYLIQKIKPSGKTPDNE
jgi:hypothetical protein